MDLIDSVIRKCARTIDRVVSPYDGPGVCLLIYSKNSTFMECMTEIDLLWIFLALILVYLLCSIVYRICSVLFK